MDRKFPYSKKLIWQIDVPIMHGTNTIHVDLGGGSNPRNPFWATRLVVIDIFSPREKSSESYWDPRSKDVELEFIEGDLTKTLPFPNSSIDSISAFDVLEHIPKWERNGEQVRFPFVDLMSEIFRCLKPNGIFIALTPGYPSKSVFGDPTHVNQISLDTAQYFGKERNEEEFIPMYGFKGRFNLLHNNWLKGGGPFLTESISTMLMTANKIRKLKLHLKLIVRISRLRLNLRQGSHILWVMQKSKST